MKRRTFLKMAGLGGVSVAAGCTRPEQKLISMVQAPDDMVTGNAAWYATTCRECPAGCGVLARNREGRVVKVEGNPLHPINRGALCIRGQAALQGVYNPDRIGTPLLKDRDGWKRVSFDQAFSLLREKTRAAALAGTGRIRMATETVGASMLSLFRECLAKWDSPGPLVYEPFAYESLKEANRQVFGIEGLPSYRMEKADLIVSFGADFLETWLSPVEYARRFKEMHAGGKGVFFHIAPYQSLTGANADFWISCRPGAEAVVALGLVKEALDAGKGKGMPEAIRASLSKASASLSRERVVRTAGISSEAYGRLIDLLLKSENPLVLGPGVCAFHPMQAHLAANALHLLHDPELSLLDFENRHRVECASGRAEATAFFRSIQTEPVEVLLLHNTNPVYSLGSGSGVGEILQKKDLFVVSFSSFRDETSMLPDLIFPVRLPLETWDEYGGWTSIVSTLQPAMASLTGAPAMGEVMLGAAFPDQTPATTYKDYIFSRLQESGRISGEMGWLEGLQRGGWFSPETGSGASAPKISDQFTEAFFPLLEPPSSDPVFMAVPSIRFFDGRGANRPWLCEVPDPLTKVTWQTPVMAAPETLDPMGIRQEDVIGIQAGNARVQAPVYRTHGVRPGVLVMAIGQGHTAYGRYAEGKGENPLDLIAVETDPLSPAGRFAVEGVSMRRTGSMRLAHTDGSRFQHGRKIALSVTQKEARKGKISQKKEPEGLGMYEFPMALPLPEGYDPKKRDFYPPHFHDTYRWAMTVDLDRCIGCGACAAACYAENNLGVVGLERMLEEREMSWLEVQRYQDPEDQTRIVFFPMLCQHCDNAPCESVCPVFAPHHSKEGINNQIYNRCIGTRFCSQNCPYKVRRFNWFDWKWPEPLNLQLNPDVTVRSKGVMEKCSFCIQRIKDAHDAAKNENRKILDGEVKPACLQTCPTGVFTFGNLMDENSRVRKLVEDPRAYQALGYLNTKPAVIYLKKVRR